MTNDVLDFDQEAEFIHRLAQSMLTQEQFGEWQSIFITGDRAGTKFPWKCQGDYRAARDILADMDVKKAVVDQLLADFESVGGHCNCTIVVNVPFDALEECSDG